MPVPTWDQYMAPCLTALLDGEVRKSRDVIKAAADLLEVTDEQRAILIPSGQEQWLNRGNWALSHLTQAGAIERPGRGLYRITATGRDLLTQYPDGIPAKEVRHVFGSQAPMSGQDATASLGQPEDTRESALAPIEQIELGRARLHADVAADLLSRLHAQEPAFFEQAVLDLLMAMGYGGAEGTATRTQLSNDGGIDGIIDQDALGLSRVYVQAKRYSPSNSVQRPELQAFGGALQERHANQGVFITTGRFSSGARGYAEAVAMRIVLIDGERLARLMIRYGVGVQVKQTIQIVEVDEDFFE